MKARRSPATGNSWEWLDLLPSPALVIDESGAVVRANGGVRRSLGYEPHRLTGKPADFLVPEYLRPTQASLREWLEGGQDGEAAGISLPVVAQKADGTAVSVNIFLGPADGAATHTLALIGDAPPDEAQVERDHVQIRGLLSDIGRIIGTSLDLESLCEQFSIALMRALPAERVVICTVAPEAGTYEVAYASGASRRKPGAASGRISGSPIGAALEGRVPTLIVGEELKSAARREPQISPQIGRNARALACVPLIVNSECIGAVLLSSSEDTAFTADDLSLLEQIGHQIAGAVNAVRLYAEQQREAEIRRSLAAIGVAVSRDLQLDRVFERVADELAELMPYDRISVTLMEPETHELHEAFRLGADVPGVADGDATHVSGAGEPGWRYRLEGHLSQSPGMEVFRDAGLESLIEVPLGTAAAGPIGYLSLMNREADAYTNRDLELLRLIAGQVTPAIQNARSHTQAIELAEARTRQSRLEARSRELERVNEAKSQFLALVSHELRTPLTSITAFTDLLAKNRESNLTEKQLRQLSAVRRNASQLNRLIGGLLDISKIESGELVLLPRAFDVGELLEELAESFALVLEPRRQRIELVIDDGRLRVMADRERISQIYSNLIENASKYSPEGTTIWLEARNEPNGAMVTVRDSGPGISKSDQEQLFTPFFRAENQLTRSVPGTGLGLALVKRIAEMHGGAVGVESEEGQGATFWVLLPIHAEAAAA